MIKDTIAFVIYSLGSGGAERVVTTLANELSVKYKIVLITFKKVTPFYPLSPDVKLLYCLETILPSKNIFQAIRSNYILFKKISKFLKQEKVNLVVGFLTSANVLAVLASKLKNIPVIVCERNNPFKSSSPYFWKVLKRFTYPKATYLVVQTKEIRNYYLNSIDASKLKILPNPLSPDLTLARVNNSKREKIILNVGRLNPQKGQEQLIKAFSDINYGEWKLHIIGKGEKEAEFQRLITSLKLHGIVELLAPTKKIHDHYNTSSVFAFTSLFEGFPNALIEAMYYGMACVSTDCPTGPSELIKNGENGFLIPMNNHEELKWHLQKLIDNEKLRIQFGIKAAESVKKFEAIEIIQKWQELINDGLNLKRFSRHKMNEND